LLKAYEGGLHRVMHLDRGAFFGELRPLLQAR
jgi:hypothetical protein